VIEQATPVPRSVPPVSGSSVHPLTPVCTSVAQIPAAGSTGDTPQPHDKEVDGKTPPDRHDQRGVPDRAQRVSPRSGPHARIDHNELLSHPKITLLRMPLHKTNL